MPTAARRRRRRLSRCVVILARAAYAACECRILAWLELLMLTPPQARVADEQKKKWAEEKAARSYDGMFTEDNIEGAREDWSDDDFM